MRIDLPSDKHSTIYDTSYRKAFGLALLFHCLLGIALLFETSQKHPVLQKTNQPQHAIRQAVEENKPSHAAQEIPEPLIKATNIDTTAVMATVERLKAERVAQLKSEQARQHALQEQLNASRNLRLAEQKRLAKLKEETIAISLARKKQMEVEQQRLKQLATQKTRELKQIEALKEKQKLLEKTQQETEHRLQLQKQQEEKATLEKRQAQAAQEKAAAAAKNNAFLGEVNKYKALIISAIGQQWILPEKVDRSMSSQFRIHLGPDGAVLDVKLTRSSGDPVLDHSAQTAIYKASPLPVPNTPEAFEPFRDISLTVRPENVRS